MTFPTELHAVQSARWPQTGRHILAQCGELDGQPTIVVYQAYRPDIAEYAVQHGYFGGPYSFSRMSWVKPNFLWMMSRCGWATKPDQERVLALTVARARFDRWLMGAVPSSPGTSGMDEAQWRSALTASDVRLQWDPDHAPDGRPLPRRAVQLGLRGRTLAEFGRPMGEGGALLRLEDITDFVQGQRANLGQPQCLLTPREEVYRPEDSELAARLGLD
ncbi:DUF4291 family protein [Deinococcus arenicola]|uniref:DUF4291 family protein n=1 Tax=Deinococcus arenicola TaxID=2994950 RepID=A0ABU4DVS0_9DEIO|nr:DUF4291 family protein [Deinococcus sp. ZS9-10]MDV6375769.1 DUF4291 family protein [Deinococcus sp. ZS9-10]